MLTDQAQPTALTESADADPNLSLQMQQKAAAPTTDGVIPPPPPLTNSAIPFAKIAAMGAPTTSTLPTPSKLPAPTGPASDAGSASILTAGSKLPSPTPLSSATTAAPAGYTAADTALDSTILPNADPRLSAVRSLVDKAAGGVANVDRVQLAKDTLNTLRTASEPGYQADLQDAMRYGAAGGQVGSGQLRTHLGDLALQHTRDLQTEQDRLAQNATEGSIQDSFNKLGALSGLEGQSYGEGAADRNELRTERGNKLNTGLSLLGAGSAGNPAEYYQRLATQLGVDPNILAQLAKAYGSGSPT